MRIFLALAMMMALLLPVAAQQDEAAPWQASVTGQIEALRAGDGAGALAFASEAFRLQFAERPEAFYAAVIATGYLPIAESRSHSFGTFNKVGDAIVLQVVKFVGADQGLYEALYQLGNEPEQGWRVLGVVLKKQPGIGV